MAILKCRACNFSNLKRFLELGNIPPVNAFIDEKDIKNEKFYPLNLSYCSNCLLVQIEEVVNPDELFSNYLHLSSGSQSNINHLQEVADVIKNKYTIDKSTKILEIGSNDGTLLEFLKNHGFQVLGIDPAKNLIEISAHKGVETLPIFFNTKSATEIENSKGKFNLVVALNVIPHTPEVVDLLKGVRQILAEKGTLIMEGAYAIETILKGEFDTIYHEHVYSFSLHSLINTFRLAGLKIIDVEKISTQGGSLRIFAQDEFCASKVSNSVRNLLDEEKKIGLNNSKIYDSVDHKVKQFKDNLNKLIKSEKILAGKSLVGIGAPARGVVILNYCSIGTEDISYIIDDTPLKQGKVSPGTHIPIRSWEELNKNPSKSFILLSWNYKNHLIDRLKKQIPSARIIVPFPRLGVESFD